MAKKKILVVDDETDVLDLIARKLTVAGYDVIGASKGKQAVDRARMHQPDLILMDIMLPDIDGAEAVSLIRREAGLEKTPILFLSGILAAEGSENQAQALVVGGKKYPALAKPFHFQDLMNEIGRYCPLD